MRKTVSKFALVAGVALALAFTTLTSCVSSPPAKTAAAPTLSQDSQSSLDTALKTATTLFFTDSRDGKNYKTVQIGEQVWMAENLNYDASGSNCYDNDPANCAKYGRLYDWSTAMGFSPICNITVCSSQIQSKHKGICPSGWHIPSQSEWDLMTVYIGGTNTEGRKLKATNGWSNCGPSDSGKEFLCEGTYGFLALPGGYRDSDGSFGNVGYFGYWWSTTEFIALLAYNRIMSYNGDGAYWSQGKSNMFSMRCIQD